jgi:hypothetical protein
MRHDTQPTQEQRDQIYGCRQDGLNQSETALPLRVNQSTISRELRRHCGWRPRPAQAGCEARRHPSHAPRIGAGEWQRVDWLIQRSGAPSRSGGAWPRKGSGRSVMNGSTGICTGINRRAAPCTARCVVSANDASATGARNGAGRLKTGSALKPAPLDRRRGGRSAHRPRAPRGARLLGGTPKRLPPAHRSSPPSGDREAPAPRARSRASPDPRSRDRRRPAGTHRPGPGYPCVLRPSLPLLGTRNQRKYQWPGPPVLSQAA